MPLTDAERLAGLQKHQDCREEQAHCWEKTVRAPKICNGREHALDAVLRTRLGVTSTLRTSLT